MHSQSDDKRDTALHKRIQGWQLQQVDATLKAAVPGVSRRIAGISVLEQRLPVCKGRREGVPASSDEPAHIAVVYIAEGRQRGASKKHSVLLEPGSLAVWHTTQSLSFQVLEPVHKFTFLFPERDIAIGLRDTPEARCAIVTPDSPLGPLVGGFFGGLTRRLDGLTQRYQESAIAMAREIVTRTLVAELAIEDKSAGDIVLERVLEHINRNLHDPALSPELLATTQGISVRYLHLLFSRRNMQVAGWIRQRRLEACRVDLGSAPESVTITSIALKWGFNDSSHFSRLFSNTFGVSPNGYRQQARRRASRPPPHTASSP